MTSNNQRLNQAEIFFMWLPLMATWCMMAIEQPFVNGIAARLPNSEANLAALGIAFASCLMLEAPILLILSAANVLVENRESYLKLRNFTFALASFLSLCIALLYSPLCFSWFTESILNLRPDLAELARPCGRLLTIVPLAVAYRRFYQGILIRQQQPNLVAFGTVIRFVTMAGCALLAYQFKIASGALVGTLALTTGMLCEALAARFMCRKIINQILTSPSSHTTPSASYVAIVRFYAPLAALGLVIVANNPIVTYFLSHATEPVKSLAVMPVINGLIFLSVASIFAMQEVIIAKLAESHNNWQPLLHFTLSLGLTVALLICLCLFSPLVEIILNLFFANSSTLVEYAVLPLQISAVAPLIALWGVWQRSVLLQARNTTSITISGIVEISIMTALLYELSINLALPGAFSASVAMLLARGLACLYLSFPYRKVRNGQQQLKRSS